MSRIDKSKESRDAGEPAEEWGERVETGKSIARGGKEQGEVEGATEQTPKEHRDEDDARK